MRKLPSGEPYAGKPHVRFGGRGGVAIPTPINTGRAKNPIFSHARLTASNAHISRMQAAKLKLFKIRRTFASQL